MSIQNDQKLQSKDIPLSTGLQKTQPDFTAVPAPEKQLELRIRVHIQTLISTVGAIHRSKRPCVLTVPFRCGAGHWVISSPHGSRSRWHSSHEGCVGGGDQSIIVDQRGRNGKPDLPGEKLLLPLHRLPLCWAGGSWDCALGRGVCGRMYMASFIQLQSLPVPLPLWISGPVTCVFFGREPKTRAHKVETQQYEEKDGVGECKTFISRTSL